MTILKLTLAAALITVLAPSAQALSRLEQCQDEARIQQGFQPGDNNNGVCAIRFTGSREGTRTCPGLLVFWQQTCRMDGTSNGQTCCE